MINKLKMYLFEPIKIVDQIKNKWYKHLLFASILIFIMSIYPIIHVSFTKSYDLGIDDAIVDSFEKANTVNFEIEDYELKYKNGIVSTEAVGTAIKFEKLFTINIVFLFDINDNCDNVFNVLNANYDKAFVVKLTKNNINISYQEGSSTTTSGASKLALTKNKELYSYSYEELNVQNIDFSSVDLNFTHQMSDFINALTGKLVHKYLALIIIGIILIETLNLLINTFFLGLLLKLFSLRFKLSLGICFKVVLLCSLPEAICSFFYSFTGFELFSIIGSCITAFFAYRVLVLYKLKYDSNIADVLKKSINSFFNKVKNEDDDQNNNENDEENK